MKIPFILLGFLIANICFCQRGISLRYADVMNYNGVVATHDWYLGKHHRVSVGLDYIIRPVVNNHSGGYFYKAANPDNFRQHIGGLLEYEFAIKPHNSFATFAAFYQAGINNSARKIYIQITGGSYKTSYFRAAPFIQQYVGLAVLMPIVPKLNFKIMGGFGADVHLDWDDSSLEPRNSWVAARMFSFSLVYIYNEGKRGK